MKVFLIHILLMGMSNGFTLLYRGKARPLSISECVQTEPCEGDMVIGQFYQAADSTAFDCHPVKEKCEKGGRRTFNSYRECQISCEIGRLWQCQHKNGDGLCFESKVYRTGSAWENKIAYYYDISSNECRSQDITNCISSGYFSTMEECRLCMGDGVEMDYKTKNPTSSTVASSDDGDLFVRRI